MGFASRKIPSTRPVLTALEVSHPPFHNKTMSTPITREELDAKLAATVAEVKSLAHGVHADICGLRADNQSQLSSIQSQFSAIQSLLVAQTAKIEIEGAKNGARFATLDAKLNSVDKALNGRMDGLEGRMDRLGDKIDGQRASIHMLQWVIGLTAAMVTLWMTYQQIKPPTAPPAISAQVRPGAEAWPPAYPQISPTPTPHTQSGVPLKIH
jgi:hypothetical protein